jgi:CRP-like cAMP-binding protein
MHEGSFRQGDNESVATHFSDGIVKHFRKNEIIVQGNEEPQGVYYIQSGYVKAYYISQLGHKNLLLIHGAHEIMPLPWALNGPQKIGIFYEAMSDVIVQRTSKTYLRQAMRDSTWLTEQILRQLVDAFTVYAQRVQSLGYRLPRERVIACLLDLGTRFGQKRGPGPDQDVVIKAPLTHQDIADSTNMSRETASRALELLFRDKLLLQKDYLFIIKNEPKLHAELS